MRKPTVEQRRTEILETTCQVVIERGFAGTRINDVAKKLGVSSSLIHYHFDSKEQLLAEAFAYYARKDLADSQAEIEAAPAAIEQLNRTINNYVPEGSDDVEWMLWIDGWGEALRNPMMRKISQELDEQSIELMQRVIEYGCSTGEFICSDPRSSAVRITALVDGLAVQFAAHDGIMDRSAFIEHVRIVSAAEVGVAVADFDGQTTVAKVITPSLVTEAALRNLVARYCDAVATGDSTSWSATWAERSSWDLGKQTVSGRAAIVDAWTSAMTGFEWVIQSSPQMIFEVDEQHGVGSGRVTVNERFKRTDGKIGGLLAVYHDRYVRHAGQWLFSERRLQVVERT